MRGKVDALYGRGGVTTEVAKPKTPLPCSSSARSYSFVLNDADKVLRTGLRRKSLTGDTSHPIALQLSGGKVNIPVEHVPEDDTEECSIESVKHTIRSVQPELPESRNFAKNPSSSKVSANASQSASKTDRKLPSKTEDNDSNKESRELMLSLCEYEKTIKELENAADTSYDPHKYSDNEAQNSNFNRKNRPSIDHRKQEHNEQSLRVEENSKRKVNRKSTMRSREEIQRDHEKEIEQQNEYMSKTYDLHRFLIIPDGNCLYRAVAQACLLDQNQHSVFRQLAIDHIRENVKEFKDIIEGDVDFFLSVAQQEGEWAGYPEILALSRILDININITTGGTPNNPKVQLMVHHFERAEASKDLKDCTTRESIWLSWLSNGHYDTFTDKPMENLTYDKWLASKQSRIENDAAIASRIQMDDINKVQQLNHNRYEGSRMASSATCPTQDTSKANVMIDNNYDSSYFALGQQNRDTEIQAHAHEYPKSTVRSQRHLQEDSSSLENFRFLDFDDNKTEQSSCAKESLPNDHSFSSRHAQSSVGHTPPNSSISSSEDNPATKFDDELARTLQEEEQEKYLRQAQEYYYYSSDYA